MIGSFQKDIPDFGLHEWHIDTQLFLTSLHLTPKWQMTGLHFVPHFYPPVTPPTSSTPLHRKTRDNICYEVSKRSES